MLHVTLQIRTIDFFEECIKEEEYEAQKLDILRDAVRAKIDYSQQSDRISVSDNAPANQLPPILEQNGHEIDTNASSELSTEQASPAVEQNSHEVVANVFSEQPTEQVAPIVEQNGNEIHANGNDAADSAN